MLVNSLMKTIRPTLLGNDNLNLKGDNSSLKFHAVLKTYKPSGEQSLFIEIKEHLIKNNNNKGIY